MSSLQNNPFMLAADNPTQLLHLLEADPTIASSQDEHGYSLVHAAASYNHIDLLRTLVLNFKVPVNLKDEDGETALFVVESLECVRTLVEDLHADVNIRGEDGKTAKEKIDEEGEFPEVSAYLKSLEHNANAIHEDGVETETNGTSNEPASSLIDHPPPLPAGVSINIGTMSPEDIDAEVIDTDLRRRIEDLASRSDFEGEEGQKELRDLITQALRTQATEERTVRQRIE